MLVDLTPAGWTLRERAASVPETLRCGLPLALDDAAALRDALWRYVQALRTGGAGEMADGDPPAPSVSSRSRRRLSTPQGVEKFVCGERGGPRASAPSARLGSHLPQKPLGEVGRAGGV